jgi:hypothetical protein
MSVYIELLHGRHYPNEELGDWGFNGPVLGPFPFFHITYGIHIKLGDEGIIVMGKEIDFPSWDSNDYIDFLGGLYGDMSVFGPEYIKNDLRKRLTRTNQVLRMPIDKVPLLLNDPEEWIRIYASHVLEGKL